MDKPAFIDNLGGNTLEDALAQSLGDSWEPPAEVRIAHRLL